MRRVLISVAAVVSFTMMACPGHAIAQGVAAARATQPEGVDLSTGWKLLKEGDADGAIEQDAKHPKRVDAAHVLRMSVTTTAPPKKGRIGAINTTPLAVQKGENVDVAFFAAAEPKSIGLVFSLETDDGKVLARTTLPEIGRGRPGGEAETDGAWRDYVVRLNVRASDSKAHLTITPIEPITVWLDEVKILKRPAAD